MLVNGEARVFKVVVIDVAINLRFLFEETGNERSSACRCLTTKCGFPMMKLVLILRFFRRFILARIFFIGTSFSD